jgi:ADP-ribosylglycohydrolase
MQCSLYHELAEKLASSGMPQEDAIASLGEGWVAEEALAISIYCALVARDFRHGVILAKRTGIYRVVRADTITVLTIAQILIQFVCAR